MMEAFERILDKALTPLKGASSPVWQAARYSALGGGKRVRPELLLRTCLFFDPGLPPVALPFAAALEMVHSYSLIHDDLPAMDDDDFRRGRPSCHKAYGEATAILAGDLLLNRAYETMLAAYARDPDPGALKAMRVLALAAGGEGMILGQDPDLALEEAAGSISLEEVAAMAELKTARLLRAALLMGASLSGAPTDLMDLFSDLGLAAGLAFQIQDDILDLTASRDTLGKTPGKDESAGKKTFVTVAGLEGAGKALDQQVARMESLLHQLSGRGSGAGQFAGFLRRQIGRSH